MEVEIEILVELEEVISAGVDIIMFDNFSFEMMCEVVKINVGCVVLENFGNIMLDNFKECVETGVDYILVGVLIKYFKVFDLLMCFKL